MHVFFRLLSHINKWLNVNVYKKECKCIFFYIEQIFTIILFFGRNGTIIFISQIHRFLSNQMVSRMRISCSWLTCHLTDASIHKIEQNNETILLGRHVANHGSWLWNNYTKDLKNRDNLTFSSTHFYLKNRDWLTSENMRSMWSTSPISPRIKASHQSLTAFHLHVHLFHWQVGNKSLDNGPYFSVFIIKGRCSFIPEW